MARELHFGISDQSKAGIHRWDDAQALLREKRWHGAMYGAGYVVECALKKKLMEKFDCRNLDELETEVLRREALRSDATIFTHRLESLLRVAGGTDRIRRNQQVWQQFLIVNQWLPAWRYAPDRGQQDDAEDFLTAVSQVRHWIEADI
jgi:HEPN domain-containing protein